MANDAPSPPTGLPASSPSFPPRQPHTSKPPPPEMRYIFMASYRKNDKNPTPAHIGSRNASQMKFFPICGRLLSGSVSDSPWMPRDKRLCPACIARYSKDFGKSPPWEFKK